MSAQEELTFSDAVAPVTSAEPLLRVRGLVKHFSVDRGLIGSGAKLHAVDGVDLEVHPGEVLAVVGESGSGKSTLARCILRLIDATEGTIEFAGEDVTHIAGRRLAAFRQQVQPVFQDPFSSLDPRWRVRRSIREALDAYRIGTPPSATPARTTCSSAWGSTPRSPTGGPTSSRAASGSASGSPLRSRRRRG